MNYVKRTVGRDGIERLYLRKKGLPSHRLMSPWGSEELRREVDALVKALAPEPLTRGTLREALRAYELNSSDFRGLAQSTKDIYRLFLKEFDEDMGHLPVARFTPAVVLKLKDTWSERGYRAANLRLQVLSNVLRPCLIAGTLEKDPFPLVGQARRPAELGEPHRVWPADVLNVVILAALDEGKPGLARAVAIARYVGARRADLCAITRNARQGGRFRFLSGKRRAFVDVREDHELTRWLDSTPDRPSDTPRRGRKLAAGTTATEPLTLVFNLAGRAYSPNGLALELRKLVERLHKAGKIDSADYDFHGLRHTRGVEAALAGCTDAQGAALLGHHDARTFNRYRRQADRLSMADDGAAKIENLRERRENGPLTNKVGKK